MRYYVYYLDDRIVAHQQSPYQLPPPAVEISETEYRELGYGIIIPKTIELPPDPPTNEELDVEQVWLRAQVQMLQAQNTFLEDCLLEMANEVYA